jgi:hypothetical protein
MGLLKVRGNLWNPSTGSGRAEKHSDTSIVSSTSVVFDADLHVPLIAHAHYRLHALLFMTVQGDGIRLSLGGPRIVAEAMKVQALIYDSGLQSSLRLAALNTEITHSAPGGGDHCISLDGSVFVGAVGGELHVAWAQQSSNANPLYMQKNSFLEVTRLP